MTQTEIQAILEQHKKWLENEVGGERAVLADADLTRADLTRADLAGANIDFSCLPLWCGSLTAHYDDRQLVQIAYHLCRAGLQSKNASADTKADLSKLIDFANKFHRVEACGLISL